MRKLFALERVSGPSVGSLRSPFHRFDRGGPLAGQWKAQVVAAWRDLPLGARSKLLHAELTKPRIQPVLAAAPVASLDDEVGARCPGDPVLLRGEGAIDADAYDTVNVAQGYDRE